MVLLLFSSMNHLPTFVTAVLVYILAAAAFSFHIHKGKVLLEDYYVRNLNRDRELNHRVMNQLSLLKSLVEIKAAEPDVGIDDYRNELLAAITSFGKIYENLLYSEDVHIIELKKYLRTIIDEYRKSLSVDIGFTVFDETLEVRSDKAAYIGMVFSELIGNSMKHVSVNGLMINISLSLYPGELVIVFRDNGNVEEPHFESGRGFGRQIIESIVNESLDGRFEVIINGKYINMITIPLDVLTEEGGKCGSAADNIKRGCEDTEEKDDLVADSVSC